MNIGILVIATNKYIKYLNPLVESIEKHFLIDHQKTIFCFTNHIEHETYNNVVKLYQDHLNWPYITLKRYEIILNNKEYYKKMDYLYYLDVDMLINDYVGDEFIPHEKDLLCVMHPGYFQNSLFQPFDRNEKSTAYIPENSPNNVYHCGGVQGGKKDKYLEMCNHLNDNINGDLKNEIIADWHDESHWNRYLIDNPDSYKEMDSSYCYPEELNLDIQKRILALCKNHEEMRS